MVLRDSTVRPLAEPDREGYLHTSTEQTISGGSDGHADAAIAPEVEPNGGSLSIQLCDATGGSCGTATTVNTANGTRVAQQIVWQNASPTAAQQQSVKITKSSGTYGQLDAVEVIP